MEGVGSSRKITYEQTVKKLKTYDVSLVLWNAKGWIVCRVVDGLSPLDSRSIWFVLGFVSNFGEPGRGASWEV